jgi:DNA-binding transcriptional LysR family regulator
MAVVSNFDAAFRVVAAGLAISVVPRQVSDVYRRLKNVHMVALTDVWAKRRFALCFRDADTLQPAAARLLRHLMDKAEDESSEHHEG